MADQTLNVASPSWRRGYHSSWCGHPGEKFLPPSKKGRFLNNKVLPFTLQFVFMTLWTLKSFFFLAIST
uniref:Uncharacterized protein n=1 Tax=Arundo donax TaxID=35708 RepID=A0A0A9GP73_ARUDO